MRDLTDFENRANCWSSYNRSIHHLYPMTQAMFPDSDCMFQDTTALVHTAHVVANWHKEQGS